MFWILIFSITLIINLWIDYVESKQKLGSSTARKNLLYRIPKFLFALAFLFIVSLFGDYGWTRFVIILYVGIILWLISWFFRKKKAGNLLIDTGRPLQNGFAFSIGLLIGAIVIYQIWLLVQNGAPKYGSFELLITSLFCWAGFAILIVALCLTKFELRKNGICFKYSLITWQRIDLYTWEPDQPHVGTDALTIRLKPQFLRGTNFIRVAIPTKYKAVVSHILDEQLQAKGYRSAEQKV